MIAFIVISRAIFQQKLTICDFQNPVLKVISLFVCLFVCHDNSKATFLGGKIGEVLNHFIRQHIYPRLLETVELTPCLLQYTIFQDPGHF